MIEFVHSFIHILSMNEKAYFKKKAMFYSGVKDKNYIRLYNALDKMERYDKAKLKNKFKNDPLGKHLSSEANYLFEQLLKSLVNFDNSKRAKLQKLILYINILITKGFQKRAMKLLYKAKKIAYGFEDFSTILKLIEMEEELLFKRGVLSFTDKLEILSEERDKIYSQISNLKQLRLMEEQTREMQFFDIAIQEIPNHPHFYLDRMHTPQFLPLSLRAKEHWYYIQGVALYMIGKYDEARDITEKFVDFFEGHQHLFNINKLIASMSNYLYYSSQAKDETSFHKMLPRLEKLEKDSPINKMYIGYVKYSRGLNLYFQTKNHTASDAILNKIASFFNKYKAELVDVQSNYILFLSVRACIASSNYSAANKWLNKWNQQGFLPFVVMYARLFSLIVYLELGWYDLLEAEVENAYKALKRHHKYDELSRAFLMFFRQFVKKPNQLPQSLQKLEVKLIATYANPERNRDFEYFNFLEWCQKKRVSLISNKNTTN